MTAPQKLKAWREKRKGRTGSPLSQVEAAALVEASGPAWSDWEHGNKVPDIESALRIQNVTKIRMAEWAFFARMKREEREARDAATKKAG